MHRFLRLTLYQISVTMKTTFVATIAVLALAVLSTEALKDDDCEGEFVYLKLLGFRKCPN